MNYIKFLFVCLLPFITFSQDQSLLNYTRMADSLDNEGDYQQSLKYRELALKEKEHSNDYIIYLKAKWHYTQACIFERKGGQDNHRKALENSLAAKKLCQEITNKHNQYTYFNHLISNRIYHEYGYLGKWKDALIHAKENYKILKDTFPEYHQKMLFIIDDLGFINTVLEDPQRANEYYSKSLKLYKKYHPNNLKDVYLNFDRMIDNYRKMGLRKEEFNLLIDAENYWTHISDDVDAFYSQYKTYKKLASWYAFYGNYGIAESYLFKQEKLFDSVSKSHKKTEQKALDRKDFWELNTNYIKLYLDQGNAKKAMHYIGKSKELLKESNRYYRWDVEGEANLYFYESQLPGNSFETSEALLIKAVDLVNLTKDKHFLNVLPYLTKLYEFYIDNSKNEKALEILTKLMHTEPLIDDNSKFKLQCSKTSLLKDELNHELSEIAYKEAFLHLLKDTSQPLSLNRVKASELKEFYTYSTLDGILQIADFYLDWYHISSVDYHFESALNLYALASDFFNKIYIGDSYNANLFNSYKKIESGLLACSLIKDNESIINNTIEALENNSSILSWSRFMYSKNVSYLNVPDSILDKETHIKSLIDYYQYRLYESKSEMNLSTDTLRLRILDLDNELQKLRVQIKNNYGNYYRRSHAVFDIDRFKKQLDENQIVVKYVFVQEDLYAFSITKSKSTIHKIMDEKPIKKMIETYVSNIKTYDSELVMDENLQAIIQPFLSSNHSRITVIPDEVLNTLPFETLVPKYIDSSFVISYSSSFSLYQEQMTTTYKIDNIKVGLFVPQGKTASMTGNYLPNVLKEIEGISQECEASIFYEASKHDFLENASSHNVLHLAMHTTLDVNNPELSSLNFKDDQLLVGSLYNQSFKSDLAVLSACDTGSGVLYHGEGIQSISRAFTYTGVPSTIMSLWKVDDKATAAIMTYFYQYLNDGNPKDFALKLAKKAYLNSNIDQELKHPYYWSGFIISGNIEPFKSNNHFKFWWVILCILPLIALVYFNKSKFRK